MSTKRIVKLWDDSEAKYYYQLEKFVPWDKEHSCYGCMDDWRRQQKKCSSNRDHWQYISSGGEKWAKATAKHYQIEVPTTAQSREKESNE